MGVLLFGVGCPIFLIDGNQQIADAKKQDTAAYHQVGSGQQVAGGAFCQVVKGPNQGKERKGFHQDASWMYNQLDGLFSV